MRKSGIFILMSFVLLFFGCKTEKRRAETSGVVIGEIKIHRFDVDFWDINKKNVSKSLEQLNEQYPEFLPIYIQQALQLDNWQEAETAEILEQYFFPDTTIQSLYNECLTQYADVSDIEKQLAEAFKRAKVFFPDSNVPQIYFHVSAGANPDAILFGNNIAISIDNYLGADFYLYKGTVYDYLRYNMRREKVVSDVVTIWLANRFPFVRQNNQLIEEMFYRGKILYLLSVLLPEEKEEVLMGYSLEQMKWCKERESDFWLYMIENKHLFSTEGRLVVKYLNDAPFTSFFSDASPGRIGVFVGWQIVESYMKNNPQVTPLQLAENTNYREILEQSKYNP